MKHPSKLLKISSMIVMSATNVGMYIISAAVIFNCMYMEIIEKVNPALVAPSFFVGLICLAASILYSRFIFWAFKEFVTPAKSQKKEER